MKTFRFTFAVLFFALTSLAISADVPSSANAAAVDATSAFMKPFHDLATKTEQVLGQLQPLVAKLANPDTAMNNAMEVWKNTSTLYSGLWSFYVVGASAVLGFALSDKYAKLPESVRRALLFLFAIFAAASLASIWRSLEIYNAATEQLRAGMASTNGSIAAEMWTTEVCLVIFLHVAVDGCVGFILHKRLKATPTEEVDKRD